ncbi:PQQ-dependent sugar dehydrogenase [Achromobacter anxifer]|uniref:PQQ-dependent sugar dehydrogenase n=1 Tax=Achromobacter anxifer TaxID=1287737 RepID=UPI0023F92F49|nr:sorbosone dehydrogenase family protein [Achromobacter anxifer]MDF8362349.1 sorbosone dehydrogenase family protein [Achromobacter anxifer]
MSTPRLLLAAVLAAATLNACGEMATLPVEAGMGPSPQLPAPNTTLIPTVKTAKAVGWPAGAHPLPASGLAVTEFARGLDHPRWLYVLPNGDVLVAETNAPPKPPEASGGFKAWAAGLVMKRAGARTDSANRITLLRDTRHAGVADTRSVLLEGLNSPFGMALIGNQLYVANADAVVRFPYETGQLRISAPGVKVTDLPAGLNHHWTKNLLASPDGGKLYVSVGSNSNVGENGMEIEAGRAAIWEIDVASGAKRLYASGLRNPVGMAWAPDGKTLWTAVNERDELGSDLVPDYMTSVRDGGFYGWPYSYFGQHVDTRVQPPRPDLVASAIAPDYALGPHTASLGLAWSGGARLPAPFIDGMFVGQHGSWNRNPPSGYKVIFVPFRGNMPDGPARDVLTGFLNESGEAQGRPVGVAIDRQGGLLVADDVGNAVWRVAPASTMAAPQ